MHSAGLLRPKACARPVLRASAAFLLISSAMAEVSFNRDIRPIMSDTCFRCHGPDKSTRMAGLRLDLREEALKPNKAGVAPIVPGQPDKSAIVDRVLTANPARIMPPKFSHKELTGAQKEAIRKWVAEGARYEGHWAYEPVKRSAVPEAESAAVHPIDAFVRARLEKEGLEHSPEAGRRTLIRRLSLDLTGLPPAPEEVDGFLRDASESAYQKAVDRLLASPRYAEKQAMLWLDAVRYADTCGFHGDNPFPAWPYRDYVLRSFLDNKPFDLFTREQIAGDLLPGAGPVERTASAYNRLNRTSAEGGIQPKEYLAKYAADRVRTTSTVWLGSTIGCAECHDHKFDPFTTRDFYAMKAFFADIKETGLVPDRGPEAWGSQLALPSAEQRQRLKELKQQLEASRERLNAQAAGLIAREAEWEKEMLRRYEAGELRWRYQRPAAATSTAAVSLTIYNDEEVESTFQDGASISSDRKPGLGLIVAGGPNPDNATYSITLKSGEGTWTALAVEVVQDESLPGVRMARGADRLVLTEVEAEVSAGGKPPWRTLDFALATSNAEFPAAEHPAMAAIDADPKTGWGMNTYGHSGNLMLALRFREKLRTGAGAVLRVRLRHDSEYRRATIGRFRLALSSAEYSWPQPGDPAATGPGGLSRVLVSGLQAPPIDRTEEHWNALLDYQRWTSADAQPQLEEVSRLAAEYGMIEAAVPRVVVSESVEPSVTRVLPRGNWMDDSGETVEPAIPGFLGGLDTGRRLTRLDLAGWLASPRNPLTARVFVNRMWRQFFGAGLSKVLDDVGSQGELPVHLELLDWLAAEFMEPSWKAAGAHPWDVKHLIRTIVTSKTYRQSSMSSPGLERRDPENRLLARQNRFRLDAESVRDVALAVSGLLVDRFGGPSARPYQPEGYLAALNFPKRDYSASRGGDLYRRGLYTVWQRTFLHPSMAAFDAPTREECTVNRVNSNTPLQALVLLNDPSYLEAARFLAQNMWNSGGATLAERLAWVYRRAVSRKPSDAERKTLTALYRKSLARFQADPAAARKLLQVGEAPRLPGAPPANIAALTTVARAILNMHETITRN